jgi:Domain of unknown function (DUF4221)
MKFFFKHIALLVLLISCSNNDKEEQNNEKLVNDVSLKIQGELLIEIDSTSNSYPESIQPISVKGKRYITTFDKNNAEVKFYDILSKKKEKTIQFLKEGPNGIGHTTINGVYAYTLDSIFVASGQNIFLVNDKGESYDKIKIPEFLNNKTSGMPLISTESPAFYDKEKLFLKCYTDKDAFNVNSFDKGISGNLLVVNIRSKKIEVVVDYPSVYREGIYGMNFLMSSHTHNSLSNELIISFPAYDKLLKYNLKNGAIVETKSVVSKYFSKIPSMRKIQKDYDYYNRFFIQNPSYGGIHFDKKNQYYYRVALRGRSTEDYLQGKFWKKASIIILNEKFERIGEFDLDEMYANNLLFVDNGLLYLIKESKNENFMSLELLAPIKL